MSFARRGVYGFLTLLLLLSLLGSALGMGLRLTIGSPERMKTELKESGFYKSFSDILIEQAKDTSIGGSGDADFNNPLVQKAANEALSEEFLEKQGSAFIDGNYKWLSGQTEKPEYKIDLGPAREQFAKNTGIAVASRLASLPVCTNAQLATIKAQGQNVDPYTIECLPFTTNPDEAGEEISQNLSSNSSFLNNAVLTPDSLDPSQETSSQPYYETLKNIPKFYQFLLIAPFILLGLALLAILGMIFIAPTKARGLRRISIMLFISSLILILSKFLWDTGFKNLDKKVSSGSSGSPELQKSLLNLAHGVEKSLTSFNVYFGIAFLVLALVFITLAKRNSKAVAISSPDHQVVPDMETPFIPPAAQVDPTNKPVIPRAQPQTTTPAAQPVRKKRPPRLIQ